MVKVVLGVFLLLEEEKEDDDKDEKEVEVEEGEESEISTPRKELPCWNVVTAVTFGRRFT